jgi:hypothetical protein
MLWGHRNPLNQYQEKYFSSGLLLVTSLQQSQLVDGKTKKNNNNKFEWDTASFRLFRSLQSSAINSVVKVWGTAPTRRIGARKKPN